MHRVALDYLQSWLVAHDRKPLIVRGARQVGKTWLVRHFATISKKQLIELNFEKQISYISLFESNNPKQILQNLSAALNIEIDPANCLLFLDEIQAAPQILSKLRWFAEELVQLPIIAAGSLLEFVLAEHSFSMPVGRISYFHLEPLSFEEFLLANNKDSLHDYLLNYELTATMPSALHDVLSSLFKEYLIVGSLPAVVLNWVTEHSLNKVNQIQSDLLATYRDDFAKYKGRVAIERLDEVMVAIPRMLGQKWMSSRVNQNISSATIKHVLTLLEKAKICYRVQGSFANGVPLAAEVNEKYFKEIFLDTGLCSSVFGLNLSFMQSASEIIMVNNGSIAEQVVGQLLRTINQPYIEPRLYYWHREEAGSNAEIDYVIQHGNQVIPIEVKAGSTGSLKSLHVFMGMKKLSLAIRINSAEPSVTNINLKDTMGNPIKYVLLSIPFYLIGQIHRMIDYSGAS